MLLGTECIQLVSDTDLLLVFTVIGYDGKFTTNWGGTTFLTHAAVGGNMKASDFGIDGAPYPSYLLDEDQIILSQPVLVLEDMFVSEVPRCRDKILRIPFEIEQ